MVYNYPNAIEKETTVGIIGFLAVAITWFFGCMVYAAHTDMTLGGFLILLVATIVVFVVGLYASIIALDVLFPSNREEEKKKAATEREEKRRRSEKMAIAAKVRRGELPQSHLDARIRRGLLPAD